MSLFGIIQTIDYAVASYVAPVDTSGSVTTSMTLTPSLDGNVSLAAALDGTVAVAGSLEGSVTLTQGTG